MGEPRAVHLTIREYEALPDDGRRYEILDGRLEMTPSPTRFHQNVTGNIFRVIQDFVRKHKLGRVFFAPFDVMLAFDGIVQPDVLFISADRLDIVTEKRVNGSPDLVVEVFIHAGALRDTEVKRQLYARGGVREYWLVDLDRQQARVLELTETGYEERVRVESGGHLTSLLLPGFSVDWAEIFRQD